jgi:mannose-1-phosphate guanylyltransferase/mannose-6-phosphate isomerase
MSPQIIPVIMCGGAGTRLWPVSRESMPKQFTHLVGQGSTFQQVIRRVSDPELFARPIVITHSEFRFIVAEQLRDCAVSSDIVLEPMRRDSAPAVAAAAALATERDPQALVLILAADHVVRKEPEFRSACREAAKTAAQGRIVTFGIHPTCSATNYGYIRPGKPLNGASAREIEAFVEKPDAATASKYVANKYLWNSGNFLFHAATMWQEIEQFEPLMAKAVRESVSSSTRDLDFVRLAPEPFARTPKKSIDYAVMERTKRAAVDPVDIGWSDIGSWSAVWDLLDHDATGNAVEGSVCLSDTRNSLVLSDESILTTVIGVDDIIVIATPDAVLVVPRARAEEVKGLVEKLKTQNHRAAVQHRRIYRPWGYYQDVDLAARYRVKRIFC